MTVPGTLGFLLVLIICRFEVFYSLTCFIINLLIIKSKMKNIFITSFIWTFLFLLFFRLTHIFHLPTPSPLANVIQLIITLKLIAASGDISDFRFGVKSKQFHLKLNEDPSCWHLFTYTYCYVGLFTGPFFTLRTYQDYINHSHPHQLNFSILFSKIKHLLIFLVIYITLNHFFKSSYITSGNFYEDSIFFKSSSSF